MVSTPRSRYININSPTACRSVKSSESQCPNTWVRSFLYRLDTDIVKTATIRFHSLEAYQQHDPGLEQLYSLPAQLPSPMLIGAD